MFFSLTILLFLTVSSVQGQPKTSVMTDVGMINGEFFIAKNLSYGPGVDYIRFLGIPYAETTAGENRWRDPIKKAPFTTMFNATSFGSICPQSNSRTDQSEDCLSLNIWAPSPLDSKSKHKVAIYIHGGGLMTGSSSEPAYSSDYIASQGNIVVVTINYRLGGLGFLSQAGKGTITGNYGIKDQILAMQWVQDNIIYFGGDKSQVSLFGQSAGAMSALVHLVSQASIGLFNRMIIQSPVGLDYHTPSAGRYKAGVFAHSLLCSVDDAVCLRSRSVKEIMAVDLIPEYIFDLETKTGINFLPWLPAIDGDILEDQPLNMIEKGNVPKFVDVVIGSLQNEAAVWVPKFLFSDTVPVTEYLIDALQWGTYGGKVRDFYKQVGYTNSADRFEAALTDYLFTCYVRRLATALSNQGAKVSLYQFLHVASYAAGLYDDNGPVGLNCKTVVCHASELVFVFHTATLLEAKDQKGGYEGLEDPLSTNMLEAWVAFFKNSIGSSQIWPPFTPKTLMSIQWDLFEDGTQVKRGYAYRASQCDFWDQIHADRIQLNINQQNGTITNEF